jgi:hypothetical protein
MPDPAVATPSLPLAAARSPLRRAARLVGVVAAVGLAVLWATPVPARAAVRHGVGFEGTVLGWTSWYGSYDLAGIGTTYCIDHGSRAPDAALGYRPTTLPLAPGDLTAMAWIAGRYGRSPDPIDTAGVMLALHDLRGAQYPYGRLHVERLRPDQIAGFGGKAANVLARARAIRADGEAHRSLVGPIALRVRWVTPAAASADDATTQVGAEAPPRAVATVVDAGGRPVSGVVVDFALSGATTAAGLVATTGLDGTASITVTRPAGAATVAVQAEVPDLQPALFAPTSAVAQRVILPKVRPLRAEATLAATPPPPTTTPPTTAPPTTAPPTTAPPTTAPPTPAVTPTTPPTTAPPTTAPPTGAPPTTAVTPTTPPTTAPPVTVVPAQLAAPADAVPLARTGSPLRSWAMIGCGLLLVGATLTDLTARRHRR